MPIKDGANKMEINRMRKLVADGVEPQEISRQLMIQQDAVERLIKSFEMKEKKSAGTETETKTETVKTGGATKGSPPSSKE